MKRNYNGKGCVLKKQGNLLLSHSLLFIATFLNITTTPFRKSMPKLPPSISYRVPLSLPVLSSSHNPPLASSMECTLMKCFHHLKKTISLEIPNFFLPPSPNVRNQSFFKKYSLSFISLLLLLQCQASSFFSTVALAWQKIQKAHGATWTWLFSPVVHLFPLQE